MKRKHCRALLSLTLTVAMTVSLLCVSLPVSAYQNPIDFSGEKLNVGDPYILKYNGVYYLYEAYDGDVWAWSSRDLVNWSEGVVCLENTYLNESGDKIGLYAPEVEYYDGVFYLYTSPGGEGHVIYTADSPTGPFKIAAENLGEKFDGTVMMDSDNAIYFVHPTDAGGAYGLYMQEMSDFTTLTSNEQALPEANVGDRWVEGPTLFKRLGKYYLTYTGNHVWEPTYHIEYAMSDDPWSGWTEPENSILLLDADGENTGLGHSSIFIGPDLDTYYIPYHSIRETTGTRSVSRQINLDRVVWNGEKMVVQGPTTWETDDPVLPDFYDYFDAGSTAAWTVTGSWAAGVGSVSSANGTLLSEQSTDAVFTAEYNFTLGASTTASLLFGYVDDQNYGRVWLDASAGALKAEIVKNGAVVWSGSSALYSSFNYTALHTVRVQQSATQLRIVLDEVERILDTVTVAGGRIGYRTEGALTVGYTAFSHKALGSADHENFAPLPGTIEAIHFTNTDAAFGQVNATGKTGYAIAMTANSTATYNVSIGESTTYTLALTVANATAGTTVDVLVDGELAATATLPAVSSTYQTLPIRHLKLPAGKHQLSIRTSAALNLYEISATADEAVADGATDFDQTSTLQWTQYETQPTVSGGTLNYASEDGFGKMLTGDLGYTDYTVSADITFHSAGTAGLLLRVKNAGDGLNAGRNVDNSAYHQGYYVRVSSTGQIELYKHSLGDITWLKTAWTNQASSLTLSATAIGNTVTVKIDGSVVLTYTDTSLPFLNGRVGVKVDGAGDVSFDNFTLTAESEQVSTTRYDYTVKNSTTVDLEAFLPDGAGVSVSDDANGDGKLLMFDIAAGNSGFNTEIATVTVPDTTKKYSISMWLKSTSPMGNANFWARFTLNGESTSTTKTSSAVLTKATTYDEWTKYTLGGITPTADGVIEIRLWLRNNETWAEDATVYMDAVTVTEEAQIYALTESNFAKSTTTNTSYVTVAAMESGNDVDGDGKYLKVTHPNGAGGTNVLAAQTVTVSDPTKTYAVTLWMKNPTAISFTANFHANFFEGENTKDTAKHSGDFLKTAHSDWTKVTISDITPTQNGQITLNLWLDANSTGSDVIVYVDGVTVEEQDYIAVTESKFAKSTTTNTSYVTKAVSESGNDVDGDGKYLKVTHPSGAGGTNVLAAQTVTVADPDATYTVTLWMKNPTAISFTANFHANFFEGENTKDTAKNSGNFLKTAHSDWTKVTISDITPTQNGQITLNLWLDANSTGSDAIVYVDDIRVQEVGTTREIKFTDTIPSVGNIAENRMDYDGDGLWKIASLTSDEDTTAADGERKSDFIFSHTLDGLDPAKKYTVTMYIKSDGFFSADIKAYAALTEAKTAAYDAADAQVRRYLPEWTKVEFTDISPRAAGTIKIELWASLSVPNVTQYVYIDGMTVTEQDAVTESELTVSVDLNGFTNGTVKLYEDATRDGSYVTLTPTGMDVDGDGKWLKVTQAAGSSASLLSAPYIGGLDPTKQYALTLWVKNDTAVSGANFWVNWGGTGFDSTGKPTYTVKKNAENVFVNTGSLLSTVHDEWVSYTISGIVPHANGSIQASLWFDNTTASPATIWIDAITVEEVVAVKNYSLGGMTCSDTAASKTVATTALDDYNGDGYKYTVSGSAAYKGFIATAWIGGLDTSKTYTLTLYMKSSGFASGNTVAYSYLNGTDNQEGGKDTQVISKLTEWTKVEFKGLKPNTAANIGLKVWVNATAAYSLEIDAVTVTEEIDTQVATNGGLLVKNTGAVITQMTDAEDDQNGDGAYVHYQAEANDTRGYLIGTNSKWITGLNANLKYTVEFYIRSSGGFTGGGIQVLGGESVGSATRITVQDKTAYAACGEWTKVTVRDVIPFADTTPSLLLNFWIQTGKGVTGTDYWIDLDNIVVREQLDDPVTVDLSLFAKSGASAVEDSRYVQHVTHTDLDPAKTYTVSGWFDLEADATIGSLTVTGLAAQTLDLTSANGWTYLEQNGVQPKADGTVTLTLELAEGKTLSMDTVRITEEVDLTSVSDEKAVGVTLPEFVMLGASVRGSDAIRFGIEIGDRDWADRNFAVTEVRYGTLILPTDLLGEEELTLTTADVLDIPTVFWQTELPGYEDRDLYTGVLLNVPDTARSVTARGYMLYQVNGDWYVAYTEAASRSIDGVYASVSAS